MKEPSDTPAHAIVDRPRIRIGRYYGPGRVLACQTKVTDGGRKASQMVWIIAQGRLKKCHSSQLRHASEQERIMSGAFQQQAMPWTLSSLTRLLDRGEYDDESVPPPVDRRRGRSRAPGREVPRRVELENVVPEPPVPPRAPTPPQDDSSDEELIPVPSKSVQRSRSPHKPARPHGQAFSVDQLLNDVQYLPQFENRHAGRIKRPGQAFTLSPAEPTLLTSEEASECVFSVVIDAPSDEAGWRRILKDPKKYVAKSIQKGVEVSWQKLDETQREATREAKTLEVDQWVKTQACAAVQDTIPEDQLLRMHWVLTFKGAESEKDDKGNENPKIKAKARIVILGFSDPHLLEAPTASPAMSRLSRQLFLQLCSVRKWRALKADVRAAFLQARSPQREQPIFARPVAELAERMGLSHDQAVRIVGSCYGLCTAPREWYVDVHLRNV